MDKLIQRIRPFVEELFERRSFAALKYHNFHHTQKVLERTIEIAKAYPDTIREEEFHYLIIAAWFHDTGHLFNEFKNHEQAGVDLMASFLKSFTVDDAVIDVIGRCIMATKLPTHPQTELEKILCDADTYHFGTKEFLETDPKIYAELEERFNIHFENRTQKSIAFLESHHYYTSYCQELLNKGKQKNIDHLRSLLKG